MGGTDWPLPGLGYIGTLIGAVMLILFVMLC